MGNGIESESNIDVIVDVGGPKMRQPAKSKLIK